MARVLVVGGAGYVGGSTCAWLSDAGHEVWVLDDLSTGHRELLLNRRFIQGQCGDREKVSDLLSREKFDCVMHFAAHSLVGESVLKPEHYYENNVLQTQALLDVMIQEGVRNFVFSSSCAIFGETGTDRIHEDLPYQPQSPYGQNKLDVEKHLAVLATEKGFRSIALRYFNAAGADSQLRVGEWHEPETHLIPKILKATAKNEPIEIFGTDYPTPDGTCIRDYIHVWDLAAAHGAAMERLIAGPPDAPGVFEVYNLGSESGYSVREIIRACEDVTRKKITIIEKGRRPGDATRLVADSTRAKKILQFKTQSSELKTILSSAWEWEKKRSGFLQPAIFLDRDGTLNEDPGYLNHPDQLKLLPQVGEALTVLKKAGFLFVVVSNQSGVGRGLIQKEDIPRIHTRLDELLGSWKLKIDRYELCFHHPEEDCACRKPKPKLILDAAHALQIDVSRSYMIGDKISDLMAGFSAGCKASILVRTGEGETAAQQLKSGQASFIADSLLQAAGWILAQENEGFLGQPDQIQGRDK